MRTLRYLFVLLAISLTSCSDYNRVMKGGDLDAKMDLAVRLYNKGDYYKALPIFEELMAVYRGTKKAEKVYYYIAYTNFKVGDFTSAAYDFENFVRTFPTSESAEECAFMQAYCYYEDSPNYSLDQTSTYKAINQLQLFADRYPTSSKINECNQLMDKLENKLEMKGFENAKMYYNMEYYKAAVTSFRNLLSDFPNSPHREEALFLKFKAEYRLAENSFEDKKNLRYAEALLFYGEFCAAFPASKYKEEADDMAKSIRETLENRAKSAQSSGIN